MTSYFKRLASYRSLSLDDTIVYCTKLAELGYFYTGHDLDIECESCKKKVNIVNSWSESDLENQLRHFPGCTFEHLLTDKLIGICSDPLQAAGTFTIGNVESSKVSTVDVEFDGFNEMVGAYSSLQTDDPGYPPDNMLKALEERTFLSDDSIYNSSSLPSHYEIDAHSERPKSSHPSRSSTLTAESSDYHFDFSSFQAVQEPTTVLPKIGSKYSSLSGSLKFIAFSDLFSPEYLGLNSFRELSNSNSNERKCEKNPGHFAYFNLNTLRMEQIPSAFRFSEMLKLLKIMGNLTVKVFVSATSSQRRTDDSKVVNQHKLRVGTGFVIEHACQETSKHVEKSKLMSIKRIVTGGKKKNYWTIYIQTSRHLIFNDDEAQNSRVEFAFDTPDSNDAVTLEGKYLLGSAMPDDSQCLLVCECSDSSFIQRLNQLQSDFFGLINDLSLSAKKRMSKKLFMIHHPHGGQKVLSYGDFVGVKYKYYGGQNSQPTLTKLTAGDHVLPDLDQYRKTLLYAADTCPGSCGAPILTFAVRTAEASNGLSMKPDIWMHNGVELKHKLGASIVKVCTKDDFPQLGPEGTHYQQLTIPEEDSEDEDSLGKQQVSSPVYKVISKPSHPEYTLCQARLDTFSGWTLHHILQPDILASSGFFYTGVADCVRCFQCGLGLRSWKAGDDVNTEHQKHRPQCPYLVSQSKGPQISGAAASLDSNNPPTENIPLMLLENENKTLKKQLTCKICFKSDVKDVFLPCGELYACSECSKLLTHCPSCKKPILATVTVYLT